MARRRKRRGNRKQKPNQTRPAVSEETTVTPNTKSSDEADVQTEHPLAESSETTKYKLFLPVPPLFLFFALYYWLITSEAPIRDLFALYRRRGLELTFGVLGTLLVLTDVIGAERLRKVDQLIYQTMRNGARNIYLQGIFRRARAYLTVYKGPGFWYERDVLFFFWRTSWCFTVM
jgi:hypothetical protein